MHTLLSEVEVDGTMGGKYKSRQLFNTILFIDKNTLTKQY